ncbi:unnamed protein product [Merluccius merluccius]
MEKWVPGEPLESQGPSGPQVSLALWVRKAHRDYKDFPDLPDRRALLAPLDPRAQMEKWAPGEPLESEGPSAHVVLSAQSVHRVYKVFLERLSRENLENQALLAPQDPRAQMEKWAPREPLECKGPSVPQAHVVLWAQSVHRVYKVFLERLSRENLENQVSLALWVRKAHRDYKDFPDLPDRRVPLVLRVREEHWDHKDLKDLRDLRDPKGVGERRAGEDKRGNPTNVANISNMTPEKY